MARTKTTEMSTITAAQLADGDLIPVIDVSDTTMSSTGTNKKLAKSQLAEAAGVTAHIADSSAAHAASAISNTPAGNIVGTTVQAAIDELDSEKASVAEPIAAAHIADTSAAHAASAVSFSATGSISSTDVQAAIAEVDSDLTAHTGDTSDAHDASAISVLDTAGNYTATDVEAVLAELPSRFTQHGSVPQLAAGLRWAFFGDSITNGSGASNFAYSFAPQALLMVGSLVGRVDSIEAGSPGETSAQVLARMSTTYGTYTDVRGTVILVGTNDVGNSVAVATFASNITSMVAIARQYGPVIVCTVPPRGSGATSAQIALTDAYNLWIKTNAPGLGAIVVDVWSALVDTTAGTMSSTYNSGDDVHPNNAGHREIAQVVGKAMQATSPLTAPYGLLTSVMSTSRLLTTDPLVVGGSTKPASWYEQPGGTGTAPTYSLVSDTSGFLPAGRWSQMDFDATSGGSRTHAAGLNSNWSVGDTLLLCAHVQIEDVSGTWEADCAAGTAGVSPVITNQAGSGITNGSPLSRCAGIPTSTSGVYNIGPIVWPFTVPAGTTGLALWNICTLPTGKRIKFRFGCIGVLNLTAIGVASQFAWGSVMVNT